MTPERRESRSQGQTLRAAVSRLAVTESGNSGVRPAPAKPQPAILAGLSPRGPGGHPPHRGAACLLLPGAVCSGSPAAERRRSGDAFPEPSAEKGSPAWPGASLGPVGGAWGPAALWVLRQGGQALSLQGILGLPAGLTFSRSFNPGTVVSGGELGPGVFLSKVHSGFPGETLAIKKSQPGPSQGGTARRWLLRAPPGGGLLGSC